MKAADIAILVAVLLAQPVWVYAAIQKWSRKPGATAKMLLSGCLFIAIILTGMLAAELLS